ncbi:hypothetical protein FHS42_002175 [Streptomyces zagrosensis]|uniref:Uncharacterized protein n=1 Tax=Streptomyces zagrosensis TaxID=1042984 RepID=A0A7W9Q7Q4_9ACTN|nr:hypothetical protein [Streptomyces zagrosensis]
MWITRNGKHVADTEMVLLSSEAELLSNRLTNAVSDSRSIVQEPFRGQATSASGPGTRSSTA